MLFNGNLFQFFNYLQKKYFIHTFLPSWKHGYIVYGTTWEAFPWRPFIEYQKNKNEDGTWIEMGVNAWKKI